MGRVGLRGYKWPHVTDRSRSYNLGRAARKYATHMRQPSGRASCEVPPTTAQVGRLVAMCEWDAVLFEFARVLAARRTAVYTSTS